jgi:hypothetical protein
MREEEGKKGKGPKERREKKGERAEEKRRPRREEEGEKTETTRTDRHREGGRESRRQNFPPQIGAHLSANWLFLFKTGPMAALEHATILWISDSGATVLAVSASV